MSDIARDFFISYTASDAAWAVWIAWQLEKADYRVLVQEWDFVPGVHWTATMEEGVSKARRTLVVLSEDYLHSVYGRLEWTTALRADQHGSERRLVPVQVAECRTPSMLTGIVWVDLMGATEDEARRRLLAGIEQAHSGRAKPSRTPIYPGIVPTRVGGQNVNPPTLPPSYPGPGGSMATSMVLFEGRDRFERATPLTKADPQIIGGYALRHRLSLGNACTVYLGEDGKGRKGAVKVPHRHLWKDARARLAREAQHGRAFRSVHVSAVLEADVNTSPPYLVTEFVHGPTLDEQILRRRLFGGPGLRHLAVNVLTAVGDLHRAGIVHGDLSPANVILSSSGPRLIDLGASRTSGDQQIWRPTGTAQLLAPEQWRDEPITEATDVFGWGCLIMYAATGRWPFAGGSELALRRAILADAPDLTGLDAIVRPLVRQALDRNPAARPTIGVLRTRLNPPLDVLTPRTPTTAKRIGRRTAVGMMAGLAGVSLSRDSVRVAPLPIVDQANAIATVADRLRDSDPDLAGRLDLAAYVTRPTPPARANLLRHARIATLRGHGGSVKGLAFHPLNGMLVSAGLDATVRLWDVRGQNFSAPVVAFTNVSPLFSAAFGPDGTLFFGDGDGFVTKVRDLRSVGRELPRFRAHDAESEVLRLRFSRNGRLLATSGSDGFAKIWDPADTRKPLRVFDHTVRTRHLRYVWGVTFCGEDRVLVTAGDCEDESTVKLWRLGDTDPGRHDPPMRIPDMFVSIGDVISNPVDDGVVAIVSGVLGGSNMVRRLRVSESVALDVRPETDFGSFAKLNHSAAFSPDGSMFATGNDNDHDARVRLWTLSDTSVSTPLFEQRRPVWATAFSPDGKLLAAGGDDLTVCLWGTDPALLRAALCASPSFATPSRGVWREYLPDVPYPGRCP
ncbi:TIR domain-containing protein [Nonomuraea insulae]